MEGVYYMCDYCNDIILTHYIEKSDNEKLEKDIYIKNINKKIKKYCKKCYEKHFYKFCEICCNNMMDKNGKYCEKCLIDGQECTRCRVYYLKDNMKIIEKDNNKVYLCSHCNELWIITISNFLCTNK